VALWRTSTVPLNVQLESWCAKNDPNEREQQHELDVGNN